MCFITEDCMVSLVHFTSLEHYSYYIWPKYLYIPIGTYTILITTAYIWFTHCRMPIITTCVCHKCLCHRVDANHTNT